ncbi:MAG: CDP-diacylglycerol--glycerol-3-phosphate 3-phosphatidyltransferase [Mariprofundales bacterium]
MNWTLSNQLTLARIALIPVFMLVFYAPYSWSFIGASLLFALAAITDWFDGYLARVRDEETEFGRFLDPVADKLLVITALVLLVEDARVPAILAIIIIGREITISALREWMASLAEIVYVSQMGKWKTTVQMLAVICLLWHQPIAGVNIQIIGSILLWIAALLTLWSGFDYLRASWPYVKQPMIKKER